MVFSKFASKKWPHFKELIKIIKTKHPDFELATAPNYEEINLNKDLGTTCILNKGISLNISQLAGLIKKSSFVIANDTGPAHMAAHLGAKGLALFGYHTSPEKVSIERENFKTLKDVKLEDLTVEKVYSAIKNYL